MTQIFDHTYTTPALVLLCISVTCYLVLSTILSYRKLQQFPGPTLAKFSELWMFNVTAKGDLYLSAERVLRQYGRSMLSLRETY